MITPYHRHARGDLFRLQAIDASLIGAAALYLASAQGAPVAPPPYVLQADDWLGSGTLRNSLYVEPWTRLSTLRDLWLCVDAAGSLRLRVMRALPGQPAQLWRELHIDQPQRRQHALALGAAADLPEGSRLFWHIDAVDGGVVHQVAWCTRTRPRQNLRLGLLCRTWGRREALHTLLHSLAEAAAADPFYAELFGRMDVWVLDATPSAPADWQAAEPLGLNLKVLHAPNLGGGGNASHLLTHFLAAQAQAGADAADELLIVDDDASLSAETLARYMMLCALRACDAVCSLPILMKSRPTTVWEDGGFWGRPGWADPQRPAGRGLAPRLLRHGLTLDGFAHLDDFGPLNRCEYVTFIFFGLPLRVLERIGLPAAFFLRGDDVELSLRAAQAGVPVVTNPNLAAWHEPAHSHAQEYQAILHGCITNLAEPVFDLERCLSWFERRLTEHALLGDARGFGVYLQVIEDLQDRDSLLLTPEFARHYLNQLPRWQLPPAQPLPPNSPDAPPPQLLPALYPGVQPFDEHRLAPRRLLLEPHDRGHTELAASSAADRLQLLRHGCERLLALAAQIGPLREFWRQRLHASGQLAFWQQVAQQQAPATRLLRHEQFVMPPAPPQRVSPLPATTPARELRERLERDLATLARLRRDHGRSPAPGAQPAAQPAAAAPRRSWWPWRRRAARPEPAPLPGDFDPAIYLAIHADVARAGMDPVEHYLRFGRVEGRRYRLA